MKVAFLGLGRMGAPMAGHVLRAGHELTVWNRSPGKTAALVAAGAVEAGSPSDAADDAEVVVLALFGPDSVREVLAAINPPAGTLIIDTTTVGPTDARAFAETARGNGWRYVEAPLFGSVGPATDGTLATFVGGSVDDVTDARPVLECWCDPASITRAGDVGAGAAVKVVRNMGHGIATAAIGECLRLAADLGIDRATAMAAVANGPFSWTFAQKADSVRDREYDDVAFSLDLMAKDLGLAKDAGERPLRVVDAALERSARAQAAGLGGKDYIALADWVEHGDD